MSSSLADTHLDAVVGGKIQQIAMPTQLCNSEEITVEGSLAKSAGEARPTHRWRPRKSESAPQLIFPFNCLILY